MAATKEEMELAWQEAQKGIDKYIEHYKAFLEEALSKSTKGSTPLKGQANPFRPARTGG
jgi:hypothetical protein